MSKKRFIFHVSLFMLLFSLCAYGQQDDPRSQKIINDMTAKFKSYPSVSLSFSAVITQLQDKSEAKWEGKIWLKSNKYKLEIPEFVFYFDGSKIYQYLPDVNEVNITKPDPAENDEVFQLLNPHTYFNLSSKIFKSSLAGESVQNNRRVYEIDLYPIQLKTTQFSRIRIMVEKTTLHMVYLKAFMKDGTHYELSFNPYQIPIPVLSDSFFTFNKSEHPNVEVIDLTF